MSADAETSGVPSGEYDGTELVTMVEFTNGPRFVPSTAMNGSELGASSARNHHVVSPRVP